MQRTIDDRGLMNTREKQKFTEQTANEEQRHQQEIGESNRVLHDQVSKLNVQFEDLRRLKDAEIKQNHLDFEKQRSAYDHRINQLEEVIKRYTQNILQQDN